MSESSGPKLQVELSSEPGAAVVIRFCCDDERIEVHLSTESALRLAGILIEKTGGYN